MKKNRKKLFQLHIPSKKTIKAMKVAREGRIASISIAALKEEMKKDQAKSEQSGQASMMNRRQNQRRISTTILQEAERLIYGERNKTYKHPNENFRNIKNMWNAYFIAIEKRSIIPHVNNIQEIDVAALMVLMKIARLATNTHHLDSWTDVAGYAGCAERIIKNK